MLRKIFIHNCKRIEPLLWQYAGEQLKPDQKARVNAHLAHCAACQTQLQTIARIGQGLEMLRHAHVPATQTNWSDAQARLAAIPVTPQPAPMRKAVPYRVLMGAGSVAAMALLWAALVPRGSERAFLISETSQTRPAKQGIARPSVAKIPVENAGNGEERIAFEKSFLRKSSLGAMPHLTRPFAPPSRLSRFSLVADKKFTRANSVAERSGTSVRSRHFAQSHGLLVARNETVRPQQNPTAPGLLAGGFTPMVVTLTAETPNYVLTGAETEAEPRRPRAYVMDCLSTDAKSQNNEASSRNGEERAW